MNTLPLEGLIILELSQFLSGPSAGLRLADLGARVIKIEPPLTGDGGRQVSIKNLWVDDDSLLFHTINRNKESFAADINAPDDVAIIKKLIEKADVLTHNFGPGVMDKAGLDYKIVQAINPRIIYAEISGYGKKGPWKLRAGEDLMLQSMSGLVYTTGNENDNPVPFGLSIADSFCGAQLVQGILGALIRRHKTGKGALVELSLMESMIDFQFELMTTYHSSGKLPKRSSVNNGHPLLSAPYGIYATSDSYIAIAMMNIRQLALTIHCKALEAFSQDDAFVRRDEIKTILSMHLLQKPAAFWLELLHTEDLWAMEVMNWDKLTRHEGYQCLQMEQVIINSKGEKIITTRCPIRVNGQKLFASKPAPSLGEHNDALLNEFLIPSS